MGYLFSKAYVSLEAVEEFRDSAERTEWEIREQGQRMLRELDEMAASSRRYLCELEDVKRKYDLLYQKIKEEISSCQKAIEASRKELQLAKKWDNDPKRRDGDILLRCENRRLFELKELSFSVFNKRDYIVRVAEGTQRDISVINDMKEQIITCLKRMEKRTFDAVKGSERTLRVIEKYLSLSF